MIPGEIIPAPTDIRLKASPGLRREAIVVRNVGDRPIQVGSHFHFMEVNASLEFDRTLARGMRLDIPPGTAVRFEPGEDKEVRLVDLSGTREVYGLNGKINGKLDT